MPERYASEFQRLQHAVGGVKAESKE
jgi:hypothetical protein